MKRDRIAQFEIAINEIRELVQQLPPGIDYDADPENTCPDDATTHIGGLIWKVCERVLPQEPTSDGKDVISNEKAN